MDSNQVTSVSETAEPLGATSTQRIPSPQESSALSRNLKCPRRKPWLAPGRRPAPTRSVCPRSSLFAPSYASVSAHYPLRISPTSLLLVTHSVRRSSLGTIKGLSHPSKCLYSVG